MDVLAERGWDVVGCSRTRTGGASVVQDVCEPVGAELLAAIGGRPVDALVNNAGVGAPGRPLAECDPESVLHAVDGSLTTAMGAADATTPPEPAAARLAELLDSPDPRSPRYLSLDGPDPDW
ncbi:hypothetical protein ACQP2P_25655 [Dactylosporangium sp. CA-139114]|uniref:hypothetical protein n=1 Tax=Dactylosporangium sp. CA-139114 TaxID=3239931 RepID=UPI003D95D2C3